MPVLSPCLYADSFLLSNDCYSLAIFSDYIQSFFFHPLPKSSPIHKMLKLTYENTLPVISGILDGIVYALVN